MATFWPLKGGSVVGEIFHLAFFEQLRGGRAVGEIFHMADVATWQNVTSLFGRENRLAKFSPSAGVANRSATPSGLVPYIDVIFENINEKL